MITIWNGQAKDRMADRVRQLEDLGCQRVIPAGFLFWKYPDVFLPYYPLDLPHKLLMKADEVRSARVDEQPVRTQINNETMRTT